MTNEVYLAKSVPESLESLSKGQQLRVTETIDSLGRDVFENSYAISTGETAGEELRVAHAGNVRLFLQYAPAEHAVFITNVESLAQPAELAAAS